MTQKFWNKLKRFVMISIITINPNPPAIINNEIIRFKAISFSKLINEVVPNKSKPALLKALTL